MLKGMAIKLNTSNDSYDKLNQRKMAKIAQRFKIATYGMIGLIILTAIIQCISLVFKGITRDKNKEIFNSYVAEYQALKAELDAAAKETDASTEQSEEGATVIVEELSNAYTSGCRVAELQTELTRLGNLDLMSDEKEAELMKLIDKADIWLLSNAKDKIDVKWEFCKEFGEPGNVVRDCIWVCRTADDKYLLSIATGTYNVTSDSFTIDGIYKTEFATKMYEKYGVIEASEPRGSQEAQDTLDMYNIINGEDNSADSAEESTTESTEESTTESNGEG